MEQDNLFVDLEIQKIMNIYESCYQDICIASSENILMNFDSTYIEEDTKSFIETLKMFFKKLKELICTIYEKFKDKIYYSLRKYKVDNIKKELLMKRGCTENDDVTYRRIDIHIKAYMEYLNKAKNYVNSVFKSDHDNVDDYESEYMDAMKYIREHAMDMEYEIHNHSEKTISMKVALDNTIRDTKNIETVIDNYVNLLNSIIDDLEEIAIHEDDSSKVSNIREFTSVLTHRGTNGINLICSLWEKNVHGILSEPKDEDDDSDIELIQLNY